MSLPIPVQKMAHWWSVHLGEQTEPTAGDQQLEQREIAASGTGVELNQTMRGGYHNIPPRDRLLVSLEKTFEKEPGRSVRVECRMLRRQRVSGWDFDRKDRSRR
jgi:hypothetical protein